MSEYRSGYVNSHALIVGINTYSDPRFMPLGQAESDAQAMAALLGAPPYDFNITQLLGAQATKGAILKALNQLRRAQTDDRVLVYFAGHGYTLSDRLGNETGFLACADTVPEEDYSALKLEDVIDLTRHSEAKHIGFIFDACFSGQALGLTRAPSVTADKLMQRRAYQVISAGAGDQTVSDYSSMTGRIVEALQSGALMSDGLVTLGELGLHVQQTITSDSHQTQIPQFGHIRGSQGGDFVFYVDTAVRLPAELEDVLRSNRATVRLSGVIELIELANDSENELAQVARDRLASIMQTEPEERVREAAQSYFDELEAQREADEALAEAQRKAEEAHRRADAARQSRNLTPPKMPKPQVPTPASEPEPEPDYTDPEPAAPASSEVYGVQGVYSDTPVIEEPAPAAVPAPAPTPILSVSKSVDVHVPPAPVFDRDMVSARDRAGSGKPSLPLPMPVLIGIGGILAVLVVAAIAMNALGGGGDNENDNDNNTQVAAGSDNEDEPEPTARKTNTPSPEAMATTNPAVAEISGLPLGVEEIQIFNGSISQSSSSIFVSPDDNEYENFRLRFTITPSQSSWGLILNFRYADANNRAYLNLKSSGHWVAGTIEDGESEVIGEDGIGVISDGRVLEIEVVVSEDAGAWYVDGDLVAYLNLSAGPRSGTIDLLGYATMGTDFELMVTDMMLYSLP